MNRAIHIFPPSEVANAIEPLRQKFDPLHTLIGPHMTLVFPFENELSTYDLEEHIKNVLRYVDPFKVMLQGITGTNEGYLFLNVKTGNDKIIQLHDGLYEGPLKPFLNRRHTYLPHVTIGKCLNEKSFLQALEETDHFKDALEFYVNEIVIEEIEQSGRSNILSKINF